MSHRGNAHKIEFLRSAVFGYEWATELLSRIATHGFSFQQQYGELESALQLNKESKLAILKDNIGSKKGHMDVYESRIAGILDEGQGKYAFRNKGRGNRTNSKRTEKGVNLLSIMGCFNCIDPTHVLKDFSMEVNLMRAAISRLEYMERKTGKKRNAHAVLFALCQQLSENADKNSSAGGMEDEKEDYTDEELFSTLIAEVESDVRHVESQEDEDVHLVSIDLDVYMLNDDEEDFLGACLDTGDSMTFVGREKAEAYCTMMNMPLVIEKRQNRTFRFGSQKNLASLFPNSGLPTQMAR